MVRCRIFRVLAREGGVLMHAREYFEGIRTEVIGIEKARAMLERMKAKEGVKAQSYETGCSGGDGDQMDAIANRISFEERLKRRIEDSQKSIEKAREILYGADERGGLAKLKGAQYADAICMAYCQAEPWSDIADVMQCSKQWCRKLCDVGFVYIDLVGWAYLKNA